MPPSESTETAVHWELSRQADGSATLVLTGELDAASTAPAWERIEQELAQAQPKALKVDATGLSSCDSAGLALLYHLSSGSMTPGTKVELTGLNPELDHLFRSFSVEDFQALQEEKPACSFWLNDIGAAVAAWLQDLRQQMEFIGKVVVGVALGLLHPRRMRWKEVMRVFETAGVNALPIVCLLTFLIGMVIAFESAQPLEKLGAQIFVAQLLGLSITRELGPVMAAIMLAGRSGSAFAAELGTMKVNEELNALQTMGLSPVQFLVVQRVVAGLLLTPILTVFAMYAGMLGGIPVLLGLGFPLRMVLDQIQRGLHFSDLSQGLCKSVIFGGIVASVSCLRGLQTGEGPRAVGEATTRSVVSSILLIILADAIFAAVTYVLKA
jgi:phospholipid/cholesterol/gamma-HCH transport system permease protein